MCLGGGGSFCSAGAGTVSWEWSWFAVCVCMCVCVSLCVLVSWPAADNWSVKAKRRKTTGSGRMRHLKLVQRRFRHGFREGTQAKSKKAVKAAAKQE